jgi:hypothetical protein
MAAIGGNRWSRATALLLVLASSGIALNACEYQDASPALTGTPAATSPPPATSPRPAPPVPKTDPALAKAQVRSQAQLDRRLGLPPKDVVLGGSGGLGNDGFRSSAAGIPKGSYTITAECVGVLKASLTISQFDRRGGTSHEVALDCGTTAIVKLDLEAGSVSAHITRRTTEPGLTGVAGFWVAPAV